MKELRALDFSTTKTFECGGKTFTIAESLSFLRYKESQKIMLEFGFSSTFLDHFNNLGKMTELFNKGDYFNMAILAYKMQEGLKKVIEKEDPSLRLCALFINEKGEDVTKYNEVMMKAKIDCWAEELDVKPFFYLAASLVEGWMNAYERTIQNGLSEPEVKLN